MTGIPLGFESGTGAAVAVPLHHLVVTGLTQHAGKTTTVEALVVRSGLRAVCFVTKRGELGFRAATRVAPYFRERADWQYVESLLEAALRERLKFERAWIMRACKGARTLADVHDNVRRLLRGAKGLHESVYTALDHYLALVVPQLAEAPLSDRLTLGPGLNLMDLTAMSHELQALVIRATVEQIMAAERGVVVVLPEAWEFLPQSRGGPVKPAAEVLLRQGAVLGNYAWLDSQDLAGVDKRYLKSVGVWLLGCQPEANEAEHTLRQIPLPRTAKPSPADVMRLPPGQFFACWEGAVRKVYVQPAWLDAETARAVALGERDARTVGATPDPTETLRAFAERGAAAGRKGGLEVCERHGVLEQELARLREEHSKVQRRAEQLAGEVAVLKPKAAVADQARENEARWRARAEDARRFVEALQALMAGAGAPAGASSAVAVDEDALVRRVLARLPGGAAPIQVTPPEKLRRDFQREEVERLVATVGGLSALQRRVLLLLEGTAGEEYIGQRVLAERLGRSTQGGSWIDFGKAIGGLAGLGLVEVRERQGARRRLRQKVTDDLAFYGASAEDAEQTYQALLHALATGEAPS